MPHKIATFIANATTWLMALFGIDNPAQVFNTLVTIIAVAWLVKTVFKTGSNRRRSVQDGDWLNQAQRHQQDRYAYTDPVKAKQTKPVRRAHSGSKVSPTGWFFDEETGEWMPPEYLKREARTRWEWNEEKRIWIDKNKKKH